MVDGVEMTQAEYDHYMAMSRDEAADGNMTTTETSSATYNVNGVEMTEAEYNDYMSESGFDSSM
jgi:hypothetical protein